MDNEDKEFVKKSLQDAIATIEILELFLHRKAASSACTLAELKISLEIMENEK